MKYLLLFPFVLSAQLSLANDTLTRAQVYNFGIGDTFEYSIVSGSTGCPPFIPSYAESSLRQVVTDVFYSPGSDTLFIVREQFGSVLSSIVDPEVPNAVSFFSETLEITNLDSFEIYYRHYGDQCIVGYSLTTDSLNGRRINRTTSNCGLGFYGSTDGFGEGLGLTYLQ